MSGSGRERAIRRAVAVVAAAAAGIALAACVSVNRATVEPGPSDTARHLAAGEYQKAIDLQKAMRLKDPRNRKVAAEYVATVEEIKKAADAARVKGDYAAAAGTYSILVGSWDEDKAVAEALTFKKSDLEAGLGICRGAIRGQELGLALKSGNYKKAIEICQAALKEQPQEKSVRAEYVATVQEIKKAADAAYGKADYVTAAGTYKILVDSWDEDKAVAGALTFEKSDLEAGLKSCRGAVRGQEIRRQLKAGDYEKAIGLCQAALMEQPKEKSVRADYVSAILGAKAAGDKALAGRDYAAAGRIHVLLLNNLGSFEGLDGIGKAAAASLKKDRLVETIRVCIQGLTNSGLAEYRKGNLEKAIGIWDSLLVFDPGNAEIKKAVETAKAQLGKIKRVGV